MATYQHDATYKELFQDPDMVASLRQFIPLPILDKADFSTLKLLSGEYFAAGRQKRESDIVWRVNIAGAPCYMVILLEFQSADDWSMCLRMGAYSILLWQKLYKSGELRPGEKLPPLLPIVIYNGGKPWRSPVSIEEMLCLEDGTLLKYQPRQEFILLDIGRIPEAALAGQTTLASALFKFERSKDVPAIITALRQLCALVPENQKHHFHKAFLALLAHQAFGKTELQKPIEDCNTLQEAYVMLADIAPNWEKILMEKGRAIGVEEGILIGEARGEARGKALGEACGEARGKALGEARGLSLGEARGLSRGKVEGMRDMLLEILASRFGEQASHAAAGLADITNVQDLKNLAIKALEVDTLEAFCREIPGVKDN